jgi:hypothetical protein
MKIESIVVTKDQIAEKLEQFEGVDDRIIINTAIDKNKELLERVSSKVVKKKMKIVISNLESIKKFYNTRGRLMNSQSETVFLSLATALVYLESGAK